MPSSNPPQTNDPYVPSGSVNGLPGIVSASNGSTPDTQQQYVISMGWLSTLRMAALSMIGTPRLRSSGYELLGRLDTIIGTAMTTAIGDRVTLPADIEELVRRSAAKHISANAWLRTRCVVRELGRPLPLRMDLYVSTPVMLNLSLSVGLAATKTKSLSLSTYILKPAASPFGRSSGLLNRVAVQTAGRTKNLALSVVVSQPKTLNLSLSSAVQVPVALTLAAATVVMQTRTLSLSLEAAVATTSTLNLSLAEAVQCLDRALGLGLSTLIQATESTDLGTNVAIANLLDAELGLDTVVLQPEVDRMISVLFDSAIQAPDLTVELGCDCSVVESEQIFNEAASLGLDTLIFERGQLDLTTYVVPIPRSCWVNVNTVISVPLTLALSTSAMVV